VNYYKYLPNAPYLRVALGLCRMYVFVYAVFVFCLFLFECIVCESVCLNYFQEIRFPSSTCGAVSPCFNLFDNVFLYSASCCLHAFKCLSRSVFCIYF
jgi:hypothetical protein